ncbi:MAG: PKD domain-containing protein, partial [Clostridia bacterium]|nr:PKD domain-containing protein [Clostridia bacterium]
MFTEIAFEKLNVVYNATDYANLYKAYEYLKNKVDAWADGFDYDNVEKPESIVNVIAIGEIGKISLSWGKSSEVNTNTYKIYRKSETESEYKLIKTISGRETLSYEDTSVEKTKTYSYYITGVGLYGAESEPSSIVSATVLVDKTAPTVLKLTPVATSVISGKATLSATATDNIGVVKAAYFYSLDNGENWVKIGETTNKALSIVFDTTSLNAETVKVKAMAYDAEGNESAPLSVVYSLDNVGPEKVTGLSAVTLSSKITLSWNDVTANDAASFILQVKNGDTWSTVAKNITTLGYTISNLKANTEYVYRVACVDTHSNVGEYSDEFVAKTAIDETAPVITSQSPASSRYNSTIYFSATAKDDCDIESIQIQVSTDLKNWSAISTKTYTTRSYKQTYSYTINLSGYEEGSVFVRVIATDFSGNVSNTSDSAPYTEYVVDRTAPNAPANVTAKGNDGYITVAWDMGKEADLGKYFVYRATTLDGNYQCIASNLKTVNYHDRNVETNTEYYYKVLVNDTCGNTSAYSKVVSSTMTPDVQAPEITGISTTYQQRISKNSHTINISATDNNKLSGVYIEYSTSKNPIFALLTKAENIDNYYKKISVSLPIEGLVDGDKIYLRAYAVDMAGLKSGYASATYTVDNTAPEVKDFSVELESSVATLTWKDSRESDVSGFKIYRSEDGEKYSLLGTRGVNNTGSYTFVDNIVAKESKTYIYKLEAIDKLRNNAWWLKTVEYIYAYENKSPAAKMNIPYYMSVGVEEIFDASKCSDDILITNYLWDFGDGTTSTDIKTTKKYSKAGTYTVKLSVTDNEGIVSSVEQQVQVKERENLGVLNVKVVDENGKALSYIPVYFDLGSDNQQIIYTNSSGVATLQLSNGTHIIGMYASGYLPVKKDIVVLANATRTV